MKQLAVILPLLFLLVACNNDPVFDIVPEISFVDISPGEVEMGAPDGITVTIHFQDGDGDLGNLNEGDAAPNLFVRDARPNIVDSLGTFTYIIPDLKPDTRKPSIQGTIEISMDGPFLSRYLVPPFQGPAEEEVWFEIYMVDREGHVSNVIETSRIRVFEN